MRFFPYWRQPPWWWEPPRTKILDRQTDYIIACLNSDGGFGNSPGAPSYMETTYFSLVVLGILKRVSNLKDHRKNILEFIMSRYCNDGGFGDEPGRKSDLYSTYYALVCLEMLEQLDVIETQRTGIYISRKQNQEGGFADRENPPNSLYTWWACAGLDIISKISSHVWVKSLLHFKRSCWSRIHGGYSSKPNSLISIEYTSEWIILNRIFAKTEQHRSKVVNFIKSCQSQNYLFGERPGSHPTPGDTFWACATLSYLNAIDLIDREHTYYSLLYALEPPTVWKIFCFALSSLYVSSDEALIIHQPKCLSVSKLTNQDRKRAVRSTSKITSLVNQARLGGVGRQRLHNFKPYIESIGQILGKLVSSQFSMLESREFIALEVQSEDEELPWETTFNNSFISLNHAMSLVDNKDISGIQVDWVNPARVHIVIDPTGTLKMAKREGQTLASIFKELGIPVLKSPLCASANDILKLTGEFRPSVLLFCGHCIGKPDPLLLHANSELPLSELLRCFSDNCSAQNGIVVVNACHSGRDIAPLLVNSTEWKPANTALITTLWAIDDRRAYEFSLDLFRSLLDGAPIGEAVRLTRSRLFTASDGEGFAWICYRLKGNPYLRLLVS